MLIEAQQRNNPGRVMPRFFIGSEWKTALIVKSVAKIGL
jgi:hypothetical protein